MYLWDSNTLRHHIDGHPMVDRYLQRVPDSEIALPSIVVAEALRGRCEFVLKAAPDQAPFANELLLQTLAVLQSFQILVFDQVSAEVMKRLRKQHQSHKRHPDLMIAAMAIAGSHTVVTRNQKDFAHLLPKQQLQNWIDDPPTN